MDVLAVCSDATAGYDPKKEGSRNASEDPTIDNSNVSASEVKGRVTTDAVEIADWMRQSVFGDGIKVLIGTYQSSEKVSEALLNAGVKARVLIADEAHRTAGLKRRNSTSAKANAEERRIRDFTICHDSDRFPVTYRVYQTATPRIYGVKPPTGNPNWIVRSMDDETTFGVELFRESYVKAVRNGWLSDYRIIALGINDPEAFEAANLLAKNTQSKGRRKLTTTDYLSGLAFALTMGGATQGDDVDIKSCIAFMNTVDKSKNMAADLQTDNVKKWVAGWLNENANGRPIANYSLEHLDASSNAAARETAKLRLASADAENPHGIVNVGIFGEGTDSPSLSAVALPGTAEEPNRRHTGGRTRDAYRARQGTRIHRLPHPVRAYRRPRKMAEQQRPGRRMAGVGSDTSRSARPRPAHRGQSRRPSVSVHPQAAAGGALHRGSRRRRGQAHTVR